MCDVQCSAETQMAAQEELQILKSLHSQEPTLVKFENRSGHKAEAWWLNFSGEPVSYGDVQPGTQLDMNTYVTHPWIFRASDGSRLLTDFREVYFPAPPVYGEDGNMQFRVVLVTTPVCTLQEYCINFIKKLVGKEDIDKLEIPECLRRETLLDPDLQKEIENLKKRARESGSYER